MQNYTLNKQVNENRGAGPSNAPDAVSSTLKSDSLPVVERWEQELREQITNHPQLALGFGLLAGVVLGWWVKR
tara:strand:- start:807 stop:1025 length:219 start_codon:yes stop_codon:yes gene_type:complete